MTESVRAERESTEGELFRLLVENVKDYAIFVMDSDGRVRSWNTGAERLLGYQEREIVGRPAALFFTPEDAAAGVPQREMRQALETGRGEDDRWHVRKDGSRFWAGGVMTPLWDDGRVLRGFAKIMRDRTEWKRGEAVLRESEQRFRELMEQAPFSVQVFDATGRTLRVNRAWGELWGVTLDQVGDYNILEDPQLEAKGILGHIRRAFAGEPVRIPAIRYDPNETIPGRTKHVDPERLVAAVAYPLKDEAGRVREVILVHEDVTERNRTERALRESEAQLRLVADRAPVLIAHCDADARYKFVNQGYAARFGLDPADVIGRPIPEVVGEEAYSHFRHHVEAVLTGRPVEFEVELPYERIGPRVIHAAYAPEFGPDGLVRGLVAVITDVTDRRRAEQALNDSEQRFARFMQHLPGLAWIKDSQGRYVYANETAERAFGMPRERLYGRSDEEVFPPATAAQFRENDLRALAGGAGVQAVESLEHPDGSVHHSLVSKFPISSLDGKPALVGGIAIDVTDLRRAEDTRQFLAEAGAVLSSSLDYETTLAAVARLTVPRLADWCSVYLVDTGGGLRRLAVAHADPAKVRWAEEMAHRYPPSLDEPQGVGCVIRSGEPLLVPDVADALLVAGARDADHLALLRELGLRSAMIVPLVARARTLGAITLVAAESGRRYAADDLAVAQELAHRAALAVDNARLFHESEDALRRLSVLVEASGWLTRSLELPAVQAAILDLSHRLIAADAYAVWRLESATDQWVIAGSANLSETYLRTQGRVPAGGRPMPDRPIVAEDAQSSAALESRRLAYLAEGIESVLAVPLRIHGSVAGTLVFYYKTRRRFDDATVRVAAALADLASAALGTAELYARESDSRRRAEDADKAKEEFLALLGHELRNPLAPIKNALEILELRGNDPTVVARARAMIDRQATQLTRLVEELLDASRIARGKVRLSVEPLDLASLVRTAVEDHRAEAEEAGLSVRVFTPPSLVRARGDVARLTQVVTNLLHNAFKFTPRGGRVTVRLDPTASEAVLAVTDTGVGIEPAAIPTLFQAFRQVDADLARTKGGLGLGLAVVKGLIELHGGRTEAASAGLGCGATFTVRLPLDADANPSPPVPVVHETAAGGRRVVIVEDGVDTAESLRELLELKGFEVSIAVTGPDGVDLCRRVRPDAVVCDIGLPGMTGFEVARMLRADPITAGAVLVAVSGYAQDDDRSKARDAGFDALLAKPANTDELARLLAPPGGGLS